MSQNERPKDFQDILPTSYVCSIYVLYPRKYGRLNDLRNKKNIRTEACNSHNDSLEAQDVNWTYTRRSEDVLDLLSVLSG